jgi:hypothetical protein
MKSEVSQKRVIRCEVWVSTNKSKMRNWVSQNPNKTKKSLGFKKIQQDKRGCRDSVQD